MYKNHIEMRKEIDQDNNFLTAMGKYGELSEE